MNNFSLLNPDKIKSNLITKKITRSEAITQLMALIEESIDAKIRIKCLEIIGSINMKNKKIFDLLETCLTSDENEFVRLAAAKIIALSFPKKAAKPLKWAIYHETSPLVLKTISKLFEGFEDTYFK